MQVMLTNKPLTVNTDTDELLLKEGEARYLKNYRIQFSKNAGGESGENFGEGTPLLSNTPLGFSVLLPAGYNKNCGSLEVREVNKLFYWNYNSNGMHGLYMLDGDTMTPSIVLIDPTLQLSADPRHFIAPHRASARVVYDTDPGKKRRVREIHLVYTDGRGWQRWINVLACIGSEGFDAAKYPYFATYAPHHDRQELIDYPVRPPMHCPVVTPVPAVPADASKHNHLLKKSVQFAYDFINTDGRRTTFSPYSAPFSLQVASCNTNAQNLPRCLKLTLKAGSALTEKLRVFVRYNGGDWYLYDTIDKYTSSGVNDPAVIGMEYWKRTSPFQNFNYNAADNTLEYTYCGDKELQLFHQDDARQYAWDTPLRSVSGAAAGDALLWGDNLYDYPNFPNAITEKFHINIDTPPPGTACTTAVRKIKLYAYMARDSNHTQVIWKHGETGAAKFGGLAYVNFMGVAMGNFDTNIEEADQFSMHLGAHEGHLCYLAGTPYYTYGKQYSVDKDGVMEYVGAIDLNRQDQRDMVFETLTGGGHFVQVFEFEGVPAGSYIARLARHGVSEADDYASTSTWIMGQTDPALYDAAWLAITEQGLVNKKKEYFVDCCNGDWDAMNTASPYWYIFIPYDYVDGLNRRWRFIEGYVRESGTSKIGVELLVYEPDNGDIDYKKHGTYTDHNGHYFGFTARGDAKLARIQFWGWWNCANTNVVLFRNRDLPSKERGYYKDQIIYVAESIGGGSFGVQNRIIIRGRITECEGGAGMAGVAVTLARGGTTYSGSDGWFEVVAHRSYLGNRTDVVVYNTSGLCNFTGCACECDSVPLLYSDSGIPCTNGVQRYFTTGTNKSYRVLVGGGVGLKGGGRYGFGMVGHDLAGRPTYVQMLEYKDVPTFLDTKNFMLSRASWFANIAVTFPDDIKWISFFRTKNLNYASYLQWVGDKIEFLNKDGRVISDSSAGAVRARVTIQSLLNFNIENNFGTTTKYQFVEGDIVRIYDDGVGNLLDPLLTDGYMDYPILGTNWDAVQAALGAGGDSNDESVENGASFIIPYDSRLRKLLDKEGKSQHGFWIELLRPRGSNDNEIWGEICGMYPVVNGQMQVLSGQLNTWDTYLQSRFFALPKLPSKTYLHPFETSAVTDYWGENGESLGRVNARDPQVVQRWYGDDIVKSDDFVNEGRVNGLGAVRAKNRKNFKGQVRGGIVAMHAEDKIIAVVCENDWFLCDYQMNYVRAGRDGLIAANLDSDLSEAHQKVGANFGCSFEHTATVVFEEGLAIWGSGSECGVIMMNYRQAQDIALADCKGYFLDKWNFVNAFNRTLPAEQYLSRCIDVVGGYDPQHNNYLITFRPRRNFTENPYSFISDEREIKIPYQETFVFSIEQKAWTHWAGYAPEAYGCLRKAKSGQELLSFASGEAYAHNSVGVTTRNTFFGIQTSQVIDVVFNREPKKVKVGQHVVVESGQIKYFIDRVTTSEPDAFSYVPHSYLTKKENIWYTELLRDMNTYPSVLPEDAYRVMLVDGKRLFGQFLRLRLVRDLQKREAYNEFNQIHLWVIGSEKSGDK